MTPTVRPLKSAVQNKSTRYLQEYSYRNDCQIFKVKASATEQHQQEDLSVALKIKASAN